MTCYPALQLVDKLAAKLKKHKHLPLPKKKDDLKLLAWQKFWKKPIWKKLKDKIEKKTLKGAPLPPTHPKLTITGKKGSVRSYPDDPQPSARAMYR